MRSCAQTPRGLGRKGREGKGGKGIKEGKGSGTPCCRILFKSLAANFSKTVLIWKLLGCQLTLFTPRSSTMPFI